jgi:hypothetical protein
LQNGGMENAGMIMGAMGEPVYLDLENI